MIIEIFTSRLVIEYGKLDYILDAVRHGHPLTSADATILAKAYEELKCNEGDLQ